MTKQQLQTILSSPYDKDNWKQVLIDVFGVKNISQQAANVALSDYDLAINAFELANFTTTDERIVGIFEVNLQPKVKIEANKVGIKRILESIYKYDVDAALIVFVANDKKQWRFSFVSDVKVFNEQTQEIERKTTEEQKSRKRYTYLLGQNETCRTATEQFLFLKDKPFTLTDLYEAFNVDKLNKAFFKGYKERYEALWQYIKSKQEYYNLLIDSEQTDINKAEKPIRDFAKKLLGRIVFLYFLQKKGWMGVPADRSDWQGGDPNFIKNFFQNITDKSTFYSKNLIELFYNTLNQVRKGDVFHLTVTKIPYLNGGLFDNDQPETNHFDFPENYFAELFEFFDQFNFTIDENSPEDANVGIDPEMLGHIFENLLEENKDKGAFYTPKAIVQYMCQESLIQYLETHLFSVENRSLSEAEGNISALIRHNDRGDAKGFITKNARKIEELLDNVKICDPAIGSGAFPMGMLQEIFKAKMTLDLTLDPAETKRHIIQNSIYGVDLERGAVDIARLRFWLALVVDEDTPNPLPNLDYKIMQGNSLLESFEGIDLSKIHQEKVQVFEPQRDLFGNLTAPQMTIFQNQNSEDLQKLINKYFDIENLETKKGLRKKINDAVHEHIEFNIETRENQIFRRIAEAGKPENLNPKARKNYDKLIEEQSQLARSRQNLHILQDRVEKPFFLWHLFFKDVFEQGGFDIVIGNPPYVQLSKIKSEGVILEKEGFETFTKNGDLYCLFYEQGIRFLREKGILAYITSNSWLQTQYGENLRKYFIEKSNPLVLLNFENTQLFETAIVEANILLTQKIIYQKELRVAVLDASAPKNVPLATFIDQKGYLQTDLPTEGWSIGNAQASKLKKQFETVGTKLLGWAIRIDYGIKTGYNEAFIIDEKTKNELLKADPKNAEIIKPTLRGRDLRRYTYTFGNQWMIVSHNGVKNNISKNDNDFIPRIDVCKDYPTIFDYFRKYLPAIEQRYDKGDHWSNLRNCAFLKYFEHPKLIWGELSDEAKFTIDEENHYVEATTFMMTGESIKYLLGILNSKAAQWYFEQITTTSGMGTNRWKKYKIEQLPVPKPIEIQKTQIETLVNQILSDKKAGKDTIVLEGEIDRLVYALYELTEAEIATVEGK